MGRTSSRRVFLDALNNLALGIADTAGFDSVAISVALNDQEMQTLVVVGPPEVSDVMLGRTMLTEDIEKHLAATEEWGELRYVPAERRTDTDARPDHDLLVAQVHDDHHVLRGVLSVERPHDGCRPEVDELAPLQQYVDQTRRTILFALEKLELDEQIRMTEAVRKVVREASSELSVDRVIGRCQEALTEAFEASGLWLQTFDEGKDDRGSIYATNGADILLKEELRQVARPSAMLLWETQLVVEVAESIPRHEALLPEQEKLIFEYMRMIDVSSLLFVPLGAGPECLGNLVLTRRGQFRHWSELEKRTALDIGHDLGRALLNARSFERERRLVEELRELDSYKSRLIATLAHELKNPLTAILGHTELLEATPELSGSALNSVAAVERGAARMQRLVEDLLALGMAGDPQVPFEPAPFDLRSGVEDVLDLLNVTITRKKLDVAVIAPDGPVVVQGEQAGLEQVLANLISNAAKYTPDGGQIRISIASRNGSVALKVSDSGIGISEADQANLFTEFFRSSNPEAVAQPGTGLGLAIAQRIVERHDGRLTCTSSLGEGTTFSVILPRA